MRELIYNALFKTKEVELSSDVIELQTFADKKEQIDKAEKLNEKVKEFADKVFKLKQDVKKLNARDLSERIVKELESDKSDFVSKVKELGIDPNKVPQTKEYDNAIKRTSALADNISKMLNELK